MSGNRHRTKQNFRFRFRSEPGDPRKVHLVRSVPYSAREITRRRWLLALMITKCAAISVAVLMLIALANKIWKESVVSNPDFSISEINYRSNISPDHGGLTHDMILEVTKLRPDTHVMKLNLTELQSSLLALPQVQEATVQRFFPNRIDIRLIERQPVAWLDCAPKNIVPRDSTHGRLIDSKGVVFECRSLRTQFNHLPVLSIPNLSWVESGRVLDDKRVPSALSLLNHFNAQNWPIPLRISDLRVDNQYSFEATLTDGSAITFGHDDTAKQTQRLALIYQWAKDNHRLVATAKPIIAKHTPVTFVARQIPPPLVESPSPSPSLRTPSVNTSSARPRTDIANTKRTN